jgi:hypothetical protein
MEVGMSDPILFFHRVKREREKQNTAEVWVMNKYIGALGASPV